MTRGARAEQLGPDPACAPGRASPGPGAAVHRRTCAEAASGGALFQQGAPLPAVDPGQLQELVTTLEDPAARARFVAQLKALIASSKATEPAAQAELEALGIDVAAELGARWSFAQSIALALAIVDVPDMWRWLVAQAEAGTRNYWLEVLGKITAVLLLGGLAHHVVRRLVVKAHDRIAPPVAAGTFARLRGLAAGESFWTRAAGLAFAAVSIGLLMLLGLQARGRAGRHGLDPGDHRGPERAAGRARAPDAANAVLRMLPVGDETAAYLYVWIKRFSHLVLYSYFLLSRTCCACRATSCAA